VVSASETNCRSLAVFQAAAEAAKKKRVSGQYATAEIGQVLNRCWGLTCKQGYFKITAEMVKPLRGRFQQNTT
jgi:hypothetical protein